MIGGVQLAFEDFTPGRVFDLGTTVVDRDEMVAFARRFDPQPFHLDEQAAARSMFKGLAASGWFTAGLWMRAYADTVLNHATSMGSPGGEEIAWPAPVFAGDVLAASMEVLEARLSRSGRGWAWSGCARPPTATATWSSVHVHRHVRHPRLTVENDATGSTRP
jgi:acyl dehydratase